MSQPPYERDPSWLRRSGETFLRACIATACRRRWLVIGLALVLTGFAAYASLQLKISTETKDILSGDLRFFQVESRYREVFPQAERIIIVVDAESPSAGRAAAASLAERLRRHTNLFKSVEVPGTSPYFQRNALLFLGADELHAVTDQLRRAQPILSIFAADPSLRGLAEFMPLVQAGVSAEGSSPQLAQTLTKLAQTTLACAQGKPATMSWNALLDLGAGSERNRALVLIAAFVSEPSLRGSQPALAQVRTAISETAAARPGVTMRVTGLPELRQQELNEIFSGALYASALSFILVTLSLFLIRSWRIVVALVVALAIGSIITTGLAAVSVGRLT